MTYSIELDCPPGSPRPGDLLEGVLNGTGIFESDFSEPMKLFGNWTWVLKSCKDETYVQVRATIKKRVTELYEQGYIRYGSW